MDEVICSAPADSGFLHLFRSLAASVAARQNFSLDAIDDLRLAVDEAAVFMLGQRSGGAHLTLRLGAPEDRIIATVVLVGADHEQWPPKGGENGLAWKVMSGLADKAEFVRAEQSPAIRLTKSDPSLQRR